MKKLCSCLIILTFFIACTNDTDLPKGEITPLGYTEPDASALKVNKTVSEAPANMDNPYDIAGRLHNELFSEYYSGTVLPTTVIGICTRIKVVADANAEFVSLKTPLSKDAQIQKVQYILNHPNTCVTDIVNDTGMSFYGKSSVNAFAVTALILLQSQYKVFYDFVCEYEANVLEDPMLTANEKRLILTATSITRYSVYKARKKPKKNTDADWTIFIANITGGIYGAQYDMTEAVTTALSAGIIQNQ